MSGTLTADPRPVTSSTQRGGPVVVVRIHVTTVVGRGVRTQVQTPVLVIGPASAWGALGWNDDVEVVARLAPAEPGDDVVAVARPLGPPRVTGGPGLVLDAAATVRERNRVATDHVWTDARGLVPALVVGDTSRTPQDLTEAMLATGLSHLSAVSGTNVTLVVAAAVVGLRPARGESALETARRGPRPGRLRHRGATGAECHPCRGDGRGRPARALDVTAAGRGAGAGRCRRGPARLGPLAGPVLRFRAVVGRHPGVCSCSSGRGAPSSPPGCPAASPGSARSSPYPSPRRPSARPSSCRSRARCRSSRSWPTCSPPPSSRRPPSPGSPSRPWLSPGPPLPPCSHGPPRCRRRPLPVWPGGAPRPRSSRSPGATPPGTPWRSPG